MAVASIALCQGTRSEASGVVGRLTSRVPRGQCHGGQPVVLKPERLVVALLLAVLSLPAPRTSRTSVRSSAPLRRDHALKAKHVQLTTFEARRFRRHPPVAPAPPVNGVNVLSAPKVLTTA
ncbi:hypothetical protein VTN02DRAFT_5692 [Thermoascus thermophilus]